MHLLLVGISHRTAPVELRERVDFSARGLPDALIDYLPSLLNEPVQFYSSFISYASKDQGFVRDTCNGVS